MGYRQYMECQRGCGDLKMDVYMVAKNFFKPGGLEVAFIRDLKLPAFMVLNIMVAILTKFRQKSAKYGVRN